MLEPSFAMEQDGGWKSARRSINKSVLKNIIRHTDSHNKIQEQNEMWKQWELKKQKQDRQLHRHDDRTRGYMRSDIELSSAAKKESLKWNRLLLEYEETRNDRWGHSGYKELYPDEFRHESNSEIESDESETKKDVKIRNESSSEKRKKKEKKEKVRKSRKVKSDSDDSDVETCRRKRATNTKGLGNDLKTSDDEMKRKMELKNSKIKRVDAKERTKNRYSDNDLKSRDWKRKIESGSSVNNGHRDRKRKSESNISDRDVSIKRKDGKRSTEDTLRKHSRTGQNKHGSKKKRKIKHWE